MKKWRRTALTLSLLTIWICFVGVTTIRADEIDAIRLQVGDPAPWTGTLYNEPADREINLMLHEREECFVALEEEATRRRRDWIIIGGGAGILGLLLGILAGR